MAPLGVAPIPRSTETEKSEILNVCRDLENLLNYRNILKYVDA